MAAAWWCRKARTRRQGSHSMRGTAPSKCVSVVRAVFAQTLVTLDTAQLAQSVF